MNHKLHLSKEDIKKLELLQKKLGSIHAEESPRNMKHAMFPERLPEFIDYKDEFSTTYQMNTFEEPVIAFHIPLTKAYTLLHLLEEMEKPAYIHGHRSYAPLTDNAISAHYEREAKSRAIRESNYTLQKLHEQYQIIEKFVLEGKDIDE